MRKYVLAIAMSALAGSALAAMGPGLGLPLTFTVTDTQGWGSGKVVGGATANQRNGASAMCVECHTVNPSNHIVYANISDNGALTFDATTIAVNMGTHFVINAAANANVFGTTNSGGGNGSSFAGARDDKGYLRGGAWASGGLSKFGEGSSLVSVAEGGTFAAAGEDMICESCHSLVENVANGAAIDTGDNDLLLGVYLDNQKDGLCTGCHAQAETGAGRYTAFHANNNLKNFGGSTTIRKNHHVLTGDSINPTADYPADPANSFRWAPSFSTIVGTGWCTPANKFNTAQRVSTAYSPEIGTGNPTFRGECNISGAGTRTVAGVNLGDMAPTGANAVNCSNCHRPHNARTTSGAHIFRLGIDLANAAQVGDFPGVTPAPTGLWATDMHKGVRRQADTSSGKVYGEYRPLCMGCHIGY